MSTTVVVFTILVISLHVGAERIRVLTFERPAILYSNPKYIEYLNVSSSRRGRSNPIYYISMCIKTLARADNNVTVNYYFYVLSHNQKYYRTFVDMKFKLCDLILKDEIIGPSLRQEKLICPMPPGLYCLKNVTIRQDAYPSFLPVGRGRIEINSTSQTNLVSSVRFDMEARDVAKNSSF